MSLDAKTVVYVSYPLEEKMPSWVSSLMESKDSPFLFYLGGGIIHPSLLPTMKSRAENTSIAHKLTMKLAYGYTTRLIDMVLSSNLEKIHTTVLANPHSTEFRLLQDLWVMSRSDVFVVDCSMPGSAKEGMETLYAHSCLKTVGVNDSSTLDPWYQYHLDMVVKSPMVQSTLNLLHSPSVSDLS